MARRLDRTKRRERDAASYQVDPGPTPSNLHRHAHALPSAPMPQPLFSVLVSDVERQEQERAWDIPGEWLDWALSTTDAQRTDKAGRLTALLMKNGNQFLVRGSIRVQVSLPCARTLDPAVYDLQPELFLMLSRQREAARGKAPRNRAQEPEESVLTEEDAAHDTFEGDAIELDEWVREQILLDLPMFPLRSDLRLVPSPGIASPPQSPASPKALDPRLQPLKDLADKMRAQSNGSSAGETSPTSPKAKQPAATPNPPATKKQKQE